MISFAAALLMTFAAIPFTTSPAASDPTAAATTVRGRVVDPQNAPVPGVVIVATPDADRVSVETTSDGRGDFVLAVEPGRYTLTLTLQGFQTVNRRIVAGHGMNDVFDVVMQIAGLTESITVAAAAPDHVAAIVSATRTMTPLRDVPQSITLVPQQLMRDQLIIRGNSTSADFFVNGVRDDVQYFRDLYNLERVEALKGPNAMIFGRGGAGGVINRVTKEAGFGEERDIELQGGSFANKRATADLNKPLGQKA